MSQTTIPTTMMTRKQTSKTQQQQQQPTGAKPASSSTPQISPKDDQKLLDDETEFDTSESETSEKEWINNKLARSIKVPQFESYKSRQRFSWERSEWKKNNICTYWQTCQPKP
ncbi:hypothetical protein RDWZM_009831 [Blomia tropicalis]|uniref:Uncharacterized protein n=1 Tax=Blomia tropicalis TaxID=40697 RepID=A0A9Q0RI57_BLOTA|nr:hypothetical protein RDWZM_009831 [Blomia tropicalis]